MMEGHYFERNYNQNRERKETDTTHNEKGDDEGSECKRKMQCKPRVYEVQPVSLQ